MAYQDNHPISPPGAPKKVLEHLLKEMKDDTAVPVKSALSYTQEEWKKELKQINAAALSVKSKELDSGVPAWETPTPPSSPNKGLINQPFQVHIEAYHDATRKYPARFALFIGNLPSAFDDATLTQMVHDQFAQYGVCYGYVRRSYKVVNGSSIVQPWIVLQYTNQFDANEALAQTLADDTGHVFDGRRARVELSSVKRSAYVYRPDNRPAGGPMLWAKLSQFGRIERCDVPTPAWCYKERFPVNGLFLEWETYGGYMAAKTALSGCRSGPYRYLFVNNRA